MQFKGFKATSKPSTNETPQQLPLTPWPDVSPTDDISTQQLPLTSWPGVPPRRQIERLEEVPNPFSLCDETTQPLEVASVHSMQASQSYQQSYFPTIWAYVDRILEVIDTLTGGRADWFQRLFSFLFVGGLGAVVNLVCFSFVYYLLIRSIYSPAAYLIAFIIATEISIVTNFVLNDSITFRHLHGQTRSWQMRCVRFHTTSIGGTLLTLGVSFSLLHLLHISALLSQATALIIATAFNFVFHHLFTYRHGRSQTITAHSFQRAGENAVVGPILVTHSNDRHSAQSWKQLSLKTLIIIPTYNEMENLPLLLQQIFWHAPETDVLIVDDNSPDGTGHLAEEIRKTNAHVNVLHRSGKLGLGTAYIAGFKYAIEHGYDAAFEMDADFSHDPRYLPDFLKAIEQADLVIGSRYIPGGSTPNWSATRRLISGSGNIFARFMLGIPVQDCTGGFRCYRRSVLQGIDLDAIQSRGYAFQVELTYRVMRQGYKIVETPITFMDRRLGKSKMSRKIVIEAFTYVLRTRFNKQPMMRPSIVLQSNEPRLDITHQGLQKTDNSWNIVAQQQSGSGGVHNPFQLQTSVWSTQSAPIMPGTGSQEFQLQSQLAASSQGNFSMPTWQQLWHEQRLQALEKQETNLTEVETLSNGNRIVMHTTANASSEDRFCILRVEEGKQAGCIYEVPQKSISIGRTHESDICVEDQAISRLHASIVRADDANYSLIDEDSVNGTKLNGSVLNKYQPYILQEGDKIQLGQTVLVFSKR